MTQLEEAVKAHTADVLLWQHHLELEEAAAEGGGAAAAAALRQPPPPFHKVSEFPAAVLLHEMQGCLQVRTALRPRAL